MVYVLSIAKTRVFVKMRDLGNEPPGEAADRSTVVAVVVGRTDVARVEVWVEMKKFMV